MTVDIATLGIRVDSTDARTAARDMEQMRAAGAGAEQQASSLTRVFQTLAKTLAILKVADLARETAMLAARYETMGVVMGVAGNNAGYTKVKMAELELQLQKTGISALKSREVLTSLATANIDLAQATKLARASQDLAVVGNINSSEALARLTHGIQSGEVEILRGIGLNVNFENSYKKLASQLHTTSDKLSDNQKMQARVNVVLQDSAKFAGIYEEAMGTAGKQINSLTRYVEDAKVKIGAVFTEALTFGVETWTKALKDANNELDRMGASGGTSDVGHMLSIGFQEAFKAVTVFGANVSFVLTTIGREVGGFAAILGQVFVAPLRAVNSLGAALDAALTGDFKGAAAKANQALGDLKNGASNVVMIWKDLDKQGEASRAALDKFEASVLGATAATKVQTEAEKAAAAAKEQLRIAAGNEARAAQAAEEKKLKAADEAAKAGKKEKEAYESLIASIQMATAEIRVELATGENASASQKAAIKLHQELADKKLTVANASYKLAVAAIAQLAAAEQLQKAQKGEKETLDWIINSTIARNEAKDALAAEYAMYGKSADARDLELVAVKAQAEMEKEIARIRKAGYPDIEAKIAQMTREKDKYVEVTQATMAQSKALGYAMQLHSDNARFSAESIADERARAAALLAIDADMWQQRIALAEDGTVARQKIEQEYSIWYANQMAKPLIDEQRRAVDKYGDIFRTGFADMLNKGKAGWSSFTTSLTTTFKTSVADQIYKMFAQPFVVKMVASLLGVTGSGAATAAQTVGGAGSALGAASNLSSLYSAATGGLANTLGSGVAAVGNFFSSSAMSAFGAGFANVGTEAISVAQSFASAGMAVEASAASIGSAFSAALPWIGGAVLGYKLLSGLFDKGPEQHTRLTFNSNNTPGNISINERGNEGKTTQSYIDGSSAGALGSFGLSSTFWSDGFSETVQSFIKTVTKVDDVLTGYLTDSEKSAATAAVTGKAITANLGAQGTNQNANGELDGVFSTRLKLIFESLEPGMAKLIDGFKGTSQELATESAALLQYRQALNASGEAVFGAKVTMQELASLKAPSEATSAALARITNEFSATNAVAAALGKTAVEAFGTTGLASLGAREQLITLSGGIDALAKSTGGFAQNFLSEAERLAPVAKSLEAALAGLGLSGVTTRDQFKQVVLGLDLTTDAGAKQYAALMGLQEAFAQVHPAIEATASALRSAADIAAERAELQKQYDQALMTDKEKDRAAVAGTNVALYDALQARLAERAAIDAAAQAAVDAAATLAATNKGFDDQIAAVLKARMSEANQLALERAGLDATTASKFDYLNALKAEDKAMADLRAGLQTIVNAKASNADQMFTALLGGQDLQGKIDMLKGAEKEAWSKVGAGADSVAVLEKIKNLAFQRIDLEGQLQEKAIADLKQQYSLREQGLTTELNAMVKMRDYAQQLLSFTGGLKLGDLSALNPTDKLAEAETQYRALLARANGGDETARSGLQGSAQAYLQLQKQYSGSTQAYVSTYAGVIQDLEKLAGNAPTDPQIENQKLQISTIQSTSAALSTTVKDSSNKQVEVLKLIDAALATAQANAEAQLAQAGATNQALVEQLKKSNTKLAEIEARMARMEAAA